MAFVTVHVIMLCKPTCFIRISRLSLEHTLVHHTYYSTSMMCPLFFYAAQILWFIVCTIQQPYFQSSAIYWLCNDNSLSSCSLPLLDTTTLEMHHQQRRQLTYVITISPRDTQHDTFFRCMVGWRNDKLVFIDKSVIKQKTDIMYNNVITMLFGRVKLLLFRLWPHPYWRIIF